MSKYPGGRFGTSTKKYLSNTKTKTHPVPCRISWGKGHPKRHFPNTVVYCEFCICIMKSSVYYKLGHSFHWGPLNKQNVVKNTKALVWNSKLKCKCDLIMIQGSLQASATWVKQVMHARLLLAPVMPGCSTHGEESWQNLWDADGNTRYSVFGWKPCLVKRWTGKREYAVGKNVNGLHCHQSLAAMCLLTRGVNLKEEVLITIQSKCHKKFDHTKITVFYQTIYCYSVSFYST